MVYVDIHCHLDWDSFDEDRVQLVNEMKRKNIIAFSNTTSLKNYKYTKDLFTNLGDVVSVCPGLYPEDASQIAQADFDNYLKFLKENSGDFLLIGEVGLDKHHNKDKALFEVQVLRLRSLIELAIELDKPIILHTWGAEEETINLLREYVEKTGFRKFVLHCFTGKKRLIKEIKELKIYCSIPYIIKRTESFRMLVSELNMNQILVETDSPFLHPDKIRNSPLSVPFIYEEIALIKGYDLKEIENIIYRNYQKLIM